jgi:hypothetical protein
VTPAASTATGAAQTTPPAETVKPRSGGPVEETPLAPPKTPAAAPAKAGAAKPPAKAPGTK